MIENIRGLIWILLFTTPMFGQSDLKIGQWRSHLPFGQVNKVTQGQEKIYYATSEAVFSIDKTDFSFQTLTKVEGLSQAGVEDIIYNEAREQLIVVYTDAVFDIITKDEIIKISDIKNKVDIQGDKTIYDLHVLDGKSLYMASGFGLIEFDLETLEFGFTMDISRQVSSISGSEGKLVMGLDDGAYTIDLATASFPGFIGEWKNVTDKKFPGLEIEDVMSVSGKTYIAMIDSIYIVDDIGNFKGIYGFSTMDYSVQFLQPTIQGWMLGLRGPSQSTRTTNNKSAVVFFDNSDQVIGELDDCTNRVLDAEIDEQGRVFFADSWDGVRFKQSITDGCELYYINGPIRKTATDISVTRDGDVYVASGGVTESLGDLFGRDGFYQFKEKKWVSYNERNVQEIEDNNLLQIYRITAQEDGKKVYAGSFFRGLLEFDVEANSFFVHDETNSPLTNPIGDAGVHITGLTFDDKENLWISNYAAEKPLAVLTPEGTWHKFDIDITDKKLADLVVDDRGQTWALISGTNGGVLIYDSGDDLADTRDDTQRFIDSNNSEITSNLVNAIAIDLDGAVWVGTGIGVVVFEGCTTDFENNCEGNIRIVVQDNFGAKLLETEDVRAIAVDGANRKWFGTRNGIFVQSPDGRQQIAEFNVDNSPLFDNNIKRLKYDEKSGDMWIASDRGLQVLRTATTGATNSHKSTVYAYPNPITPEYQGLIAINGLAQDAEVKITDIDGQLVYETTALGGTATWDRIDLNGQEASAGVYLVFSSSQDNFRSPSSHVTKFLIVK